MKYFPSNYFDLAIVDPEYGIDAGNMTMGKGRNKKYSKKTGIKNHRIKNILMNYSGFPKIRLFGVAINSQTNCMYQEVGLFGIKC
jgi:hypothetical protein